MLTWPHSGFHGHTAVWVPEDDRAFAMRLARYCARNPVALERLTSDRAAMAVTYRLDKSEGPAAGAETVGPLEFLARLLVHIPDKGHVTTGGTFRFANRVLYLANALTGEQVGMDEVNDGVWHIFFNTVLIATLNERNYIIKE